jgi:chromosome segregation ATPase
MSAAVLDRAEELMTKAQTNRIKAWLDLVTSYADGTLPTAEKVVRLLIETGKTRQQLEHDGALLVEYRHLQSVVATQSKLQERHAELGQQLSEAIRARDAAEAALAAARERVITIDNEHSVVSRQLRAAAQAQAQLADGRYNPILTGEKATSDEARQAQGEAAELGRKAAVAAQHLATRKAELAQLEQDERATDWSELSRDEEATQREQFFNRKEKVRYAIDRLEADKHHYEKELLRLRRAGTTN